MARSGKRPGAAAPPRGKARQSAGRDRLSEALIALAGDAMAALPAVLAGRDAESLHAWRVAIRRFLALRRLVPRERRPPALRASRRRLEAVARLAGPRRDLDLLVEWLDQPGVHRQVGAGTARRLAREFERRRREAQACLVAKLGSKPCRDWLGELDAPLRSADPCAEGALASDGEIATMIARIWRRVQRRAIAVARRPRFRRLHRLRKDVRVLRYMLEYVGTDSGGTDGEATMADLRRAQQSLGRVCDLRARRRILVRAASDGLQGSLRETSMQLCRYLRTRERRARKECVAVVEQLIRDAPALSGRHPQTVAAAGGTPCHHVVD